MFSHFAPGGGGAFYPPPFVSLAMAPSPPSSPADPVVSTIPLALLPSLPLTWRAAVLQFPLRPPQRAFLASDVRAMRYKPKVGRLDMVVEEEAFEGHAAKDELTARATALALAERKDIKSFAALFAEGGTKLALLPVDVAVPVRHEVTYASDAAALAEANDTTPAVLSPDGEVPAANNDGLVAITTNVRTRETERQAELRQQSHAHLRRREQEEAWQPLTPLDAPDFAAEFVSAALNAGEHQVAFTEAYVLHELSAGRRHFSDDSMNGNDTEGVDTENDGESGEKLGSEDADMNGDLDDDADMDEDDDDDSEELT